MANQLDTEQDRRQHRQQSVARRAVFYQSVLLCRTLKIRRAAIIVNSKTRPGGLNGISSVKIAEKVRLLSKRCRNCVFTTCSFDLTLLCFPSKYSLVFAFARTYLPFITCPVNSFILWDEFSVEKSVIWAVSVKRRLQSGGKMQTEGKININNKKTSHLKDKIKIV